MSVSCVWFAFIIIHICHIAFWCQNFEIPAYEKDVDMNSIYLKPPNVTHLLISPWDLRLFRAAHNWCHWAACDSARDPSKGLYPRYHNDLNQPGNGTFLFLGRFGRLRSPENFILQFCWIKRLINVIVRKLLLLTVTHTFLRQNRLKIQQSTIWFAGSLGQVTRRPSVWCSKCFFVS